MNEHNFRKYIEDGLIKKERFNKDIYTRLYENSMESLQVANNLYQENLSFLWTIVASYYSMFYIASVFVYKKGYKAKGRIVHKVINDALVVLSKHELEEKFIQYYWQEREKALELSQTLLDNFGYERAKRAQFQYEMTSKLKKAKAKTSLARAKEFVEVFRTIPD
ncbi:MAG: hypothetical protein ACOCZ6_02785 [Nanoarchaeota archaeon]